MSTEKFRGKYRIASARKKNYDYASNGAYFLTIVTKNREHFFWETVETPNLGVSTGVSIEKTMQLSEIGQIAQKYWQEIPQHFPFICLDEMVVMPNHIHGILWIDKSLVSSSTVETPKLGVSTAQSEKRKPNHNPEWKPGTIGVIMNQFKRICTIKSREILPNFAWQPRFHDRIIRNENEMNRIRQYIIKNPQKWERDRNNQGIWM